MKTYFRYQVDGSAYFQFNSIKRCGTPVSALYLRRQRGVVLFMALIALVAMTFAAIAMVRSVDTATMIAGNVALKQGALHEADKIMNIGYNCLDRGGALMSTSANRSINGGGAPACNYYSFLQDDNDKPYGIPDVLESAPNEILDSVTGNKIRFVIERMCKTTGEWTPTNCTESPFGRAAKYTDRGVPALTPPQALYRISVKVSGQRNVTSYSQMIVNASP